MLQFRVRPCSSCGAKVRLLHAVRLRGRMYCGHDCAARVRASYLKAYHDLRDSSPTVCRCHGEPKPLEPHGPHCATCRRMFSVGVRSWLLERSRARRWPPATVQRWIEELRAQLGADGLRT